MAISNENRLRRGRLVVFEGLDASGKSTQVRMLLDSLRARQITHDYLSFPRMGKRGYGEAIAMFLRGEFGTVETVHPYLIASLFAGDRLAAKPRIEGSLSSGALVVVDRYVYSNLAFQGAKIADPGAREQFREWLTYIEWESNGLPAPDVAILFDVPFEFVRQNLLARRSENRAYLNGKSDIHETALELQSKVADEYRVLAQRTALFRTVSCVGGDGNMREPNEIHQEVMLLLSEANLLKTKVRSCP